MFFAKGLRNTRESVIAAVRYMRTPVAWHIDASCAEARREILQECVRFLAPHGSMFSFSWRLQEKMLRDLVDFAHHDFPHHCCLLDGRDCRPEEAKKFVSLLRELGVQGCIVSEAIAPQCWKHDRFVFMTGNGSPKELAEKAAGKSRFNTRGRQNVGCAFFPQIPFLLSSFLEKNAYLLALIEQPEAMREFLGYAGFVSLPSFAAGKCIIQLPVTTASFMRLNKENGRSDEWIVQIAKELCYCFQACMAPKTAVI